MPACLHKRLVLLNEEPKEMVRCVHCHLVISKEELGGGSCPECLERKGKRVTDFEPVQPSQSKKSRYRCEDCGEMIECE